jgi:TRAP transporter TAXI family solute receptor
MKKIVHFWGIWLVCLTFVWPAAAFADEQVLIGTGSKDGVYYYAGKALCRIINTKVPGVTCEVADTPGSLYNLSNVRDGGLDIGVAQSDWQYHAIKGTGPVKFMAGSFQNLRALFSLHAEPFTLVVRRDAGITRLEDIVGHRVNIGNPGSGQRATMEVVMRAMNWSHDDFQHVEELNASEQSLALCNNRVQAMVYTVGHPNASVSKAAKLCNATIAVVDGPVIDKLVAENIYYAYTDIPGNMYPGITNPVRTFGVTATVVTSADMSADKVYRIVRALFDNLDDFRKLHPAFQVLQPEKMVRDGISAELHEGAKKYYREKGLL